MQREPGVDIVGEAADTEGLMAELERACPDVVLLDWGLQGRETADLLFALRTTCPSMYVIVLSGRPEEQEAALAAGADLFVSKIEPPDRLLAAIRSVQRVEAALVALAGSLLAG
jgi:DNA-binding NarL/FixJ family response regulator